MAAPPPPPPALTAAQQQQLQEIQQEFLEYQQFLQDKFSLYRSGDGDYRKTRDAIQHDYNQGRRARLNGIRARRVPRVNYTGRLTDWKRVALEPTAELLRDPYRAAAGGGAVNLGFVEKIQAIEEFQRGTAMMTAKKNFTFIKILGAGGNGMVVLFKWTPGGDPLAQGHDVVMKLTTVCDDEGTPQWELINEERKWMFRFCRAPHIAQAFLFPWKLPPETTKPASIQAHDIANNLLDAEGLLFMEFSRLGDMRHAIQRLAGMDRHLPPEALWLIFDCLVKACIAMEYIPRFVPVPNAGHGGDFLPEVIPPGGEAAPLNGFRGAVHFDFDPKNVFLFGYDPRRRTYAGRSNNTSNPPHTQVPRFQVGDFGLAQYSSTLWETVNIPGRNALDRAQVRKEIWQQREMAKNGWFLPEQFTGEWDLLDRDPEEGPQNAPPGTWPAWNRWPITSGPGRFSQRSNIWHMGLNMWCMLLLQLPDFPPIAGRMTSEEPAVVPPALDVPFEEQRWTYGYRLIADGDEGDEYRANFTPALCETIAKCMMARQEHRPDLTQLQADITNAIGNPPPRLDPRVRRFFGSEATPPVPWRALYTDVDLQNMDPFDPYPAGNSDDEQADPPSPKRRRRTRKVPLEDQAYQD